MVLCLQCSGRMCGGDDLRLVNVIPIRDDVIDYVASILGLRADAVGVVDETLRVVKFFEKKRLGSTTLH